MTNQFDEFLLLLKTLNQYEVKYILIGGVAVIIHGYGRLTRDIDLFIDNNSANIKKLKNALNSIYNDNSIEEITLDDLEKYPVIRYGTPKGFYIDIITCLGDSFLFNDLEYEIIEYQGVKIKLATPESLYDLKKDTLREKDKMDVLFLKELINNKDSDK